MGYSSNTAATALIHLFFFVSTWRLASPFYPSNPESVLRCLHPILHSSSATISDILYTPNTTSYTYLLKSKIHNKRFLATEGETHKYQPLFIFAPTQESHIQTLVVCCKRHGLPVRVRSGGHDYEGLSYRSDRPFIVIDLINLRSITFGKEESTAWVQAGAILGELYHTIANKSNRHGFPAGMCHTIGVGGHFSGGGVGFLVRKYGLSADNIVDAHLVDVNGRLLNRTSMGENLFWALRGGGGASFGVVTSWKIKLVSVPSLMTLCSTSVNLENGLTKLVFKWQQVAYKVDKNLFLNVVLEGVNGSKAGTRTVNGTFRAFYLGRTAELLWLLRKEFPELGLQARDCSEMKWIEVAKIAAGFPVGAPRDVLLAHTSPLDSAFKSKYDYAVRPISEDGLGAVLEFLKENVTASVTMDPFGGRMSEITDDEIPFPHRNGNLFIIQYLARWQYERDSKKHVRWARRIYDYMGIHVSKFPRGSYINTKDLDLGRNEKRKTSYTEASAWGLKYFKGNFKRLALIKGRVDKDDFFWNEQSVPPLVV